MWGSITKSFEGVLHKYKGITVVGTDKYGNRYIEKDVPGGKSRQVEFRDKIYDPVKIPVLWNSWLNYSASEPPSPEDLIDWDRQQAFLQYKICVLEEETQQRQERTLSEEQTAAKACGELVYQLHHQEREQAQRRQELATASSAFETIANTAPEAPQPPKAQEAPAQARKMSRFTDHVPEEFL